MEQILLLAFAITVLFFFLKIVEMKYLDKEIKPFKTVLRDTVSVFISTIVCSFIYFYFNKQIHDFFNIITATPSINTSSNIPVFTDDPGF